MAKGKRDCIFAASDNTNARTGEAFYEDVE
jgi:hypothetical protein